MVAPASFINFNYIDSNTNTFTAKFFRLSKVSLIDQSNSKILRLLNKLKDAGCTIDEQRIFFGCALGEYWPLLNIPGRIKVISIVATGTRGSLGSGSTPLLKYLTDLSKSIIVQPLPVKD